MSRHNFEFLGRGYDPATEQYRNSLPFSQPPSNGFHSLKVGSVSLYVPKYVEPLGTTSRGNQTKFQQCTFYTKGEYEDHMKIGYGLGGDTLLWLRANSSGRWISGTTGNTEKALLRFYLERETAKLSIPNIDTVQLQDQCNHDLRHLPDSYNNNNDHEFQSFFSKWGTHVVSSVSLGGFAELECLVSYESCTKYRLAQISAEVDGFMNNILIGAEGQISQSQNTLRQLGVSMQSLTVRGGDSDIFAGMQSLTSKNLQRWLRSVDSNPKEIGQAVKLEPYYNFLTGARSVALKSATMTYIANKIAENRDREVRRVEYTREGHRVEYTRDGRVEYFREGETKPFITFTFREL